MKPTALPSPPDYEESDATTGVVLLTGGSLAVIVGFCLLLAAWVYRRQAGKLAGGAAPAPSALFQNGVRVRTGIEDAWQEQDRLVKTHLEGLGWVDRRAGTVHIPIEQAMDLVVAEQGAAAAPSTQPRPRAQP